MLPALSRRVSRRGSQVHRTLLPLVAIALVAAMFGAGSAAAFPVGHVNQKPSEQVIGYWTSERMTQALPAGSDAPRVPAAKPQKGGGASPGVSTEVPQPYPNAYGKVFCTSNSGVNYGCSGTAVLSAN